MIEFEEGISTPENWLRQAWQLFAASRVLHQSMDGASSPMSEVDTYREVGTIKAMMLLMGLAVENALKGALIHKQPPDTSAGRLKSSHFQDKGQAHDLVAIAQKLDLPITQEGGRAIDYRTV